MILCYELSDQEAHTLHQVKAHDVRACAASKAFQPGVSLEQILSACHWKSHNTFTQFYLKDVAWADSELYHLGPVVAKKKKKEIRRASFGRFIPLGLNSSLSSPTSEQVCKKGGEASRFGPVNRFLLTDYSLNGLDNLRSTQA